MAWLTIGFGSTVEVLRRLDVIDAQLTALHDALITQGMDIMATLADLQVEVAAEGTVIDSAIALIQGLAAQVAALAPNQAAIDSLAAEIKAKSDALAAAVAAGTAPAP